MNETLKQYCERCIFELSLADQSDWARVFVHRRIKLQVNYLNGLILSTSHGAEIFENILESLNGTPWKEDGELGQNFKSLIKQNV